MQPKLDDLLPGIQDYLEQQNENSISVSGLEEMLAMIQSKTGLELDACKVITKMLFHEIRSAMLRGDIVEIRGLGKFYIASPLVSNNKSKIFPKFQSYKSLTKVMNDD